MDVVLLHNEKAGSGWTRRELLEVVREAGLRPTYRQLSDALKRPELMDEGEFVIVAGGDGAIRKVVLASLGHHRLIAPLAVGTANNIARSLGIRDKPGRTLARLARKRRRVPFDLGVVTGPWGRRHFVEGLGLGLISRTITVLDEIDEISAREFKQAKHKLHRDACVVAALAHELEALPVKLEADGHDLSAAFLLLEILNIRRAGPAVELSPHAEPSDGRFDLVTVTESQRGRLWRALAARLAETSPARLPRRHARTIRLTPRRACELRIDDGCVALKAGKRIDITIDAAAVDFLVPG